MITKEANSRIFNKVVLWIKTVYYCKDCGKQDVWIEEKSGSDYYHDFTGKCFSCDNTQCCISDMYLK